MMNCCPTCGQTLPPPWPEGLVLKGKQAQIYECVRRAGKVGVLSTRLYDHLYHDDPDGGPHPNVIAVVISHMNRRLRAFKQRIESSGRGPNPAHYRLVTLCE